MGRAGPQQKAAPDPIHRERPPLAQPTRGDGPDSQREETVLQAALPFKAPPAARVAFPSADVPIQGPPTRPLAIVQTLSGEADAVGALGKPERRTATTLHDDKRFVRRPWLDRLEVQVAPRTADVAVVRGPAAGEAHAAPASRAAVLWPKGSFRAGSVPEPKGG